MPHTPEDEVPATKFSVNKLLITILIVVLLVQLVAPGSLQIKGKNKTIATQPAVVTVLMEGKLTSQYESDKNQILVAEGGIEYLVSMDQVTGENTSLPPGTSKLVKTVDHDGNIQFTPFVGEYYYDYVSSENYPVAETSSGVGTAWSAKGYTPPGMVEIPVPKETPGRLVNPLAPDKTEPAKDPDIIEAPMQPTIPPVAEPTAPTPAK
ncbi:MAG: hypothetical protein V4576_00570 [Patescibacteria group bacterium]